MITIFSILLFFVSTIKFVPSLCLFVCFSEPRYPRPSKNHTYSFFIFSIYFLLHLVYVYCCQWSVLLDIKHRTEPYAVARVTSTIAVTVSCWTTRYRKESIPTTSYTVARVVLFCSPFPNISS